MGIFSKLFSKKTCGLTGLIDLNTKSASLSAGLADCFTNHFNTNIHSILASCNTGEAEHALSVYARIVTQIRILNSIASERIEKLQNDIEKVSTMSAACVVAQQRVLISYAQMTSQNIYTSKLQAYVDSELKGCNKQFMDIGKMSKDLGFESFMIHHADSFCESLNEERVQKYLLDRVPVIIFDRQL
jgi:hypothetical protein